MKQFKRMLSLLVVLVMLVSAMAIPASAASLAGNWRLRFRNFQTVSEYYAPSRPLYVKALQRFLFAFDNTRSSMGQTTVDGQWGAKTTLAVGVLQRALGFTPDYIVGPNTWEAIANRLTPEITVYPDNDVAVLTRTDNSNRNWYIYHLDIDTNTYYYRYYASHLYDNSFSDTNPIFHIYPFL